MTAVRGQLSCFFFHFSKTERRGSEASLLSTASEKVGGCLFFLAFPCLY